MSTTTLPPMRTAYLPSPIGPIGIECSRTHCYKILLNPTQPNSTTPNTHIEKQVANAIINYFQGPHNSLNLALLNIQGTDLQCKIWQHLYSIPLGQTRTYGELATELNTHARVIGNACRQNPTPLFIPCHRILAAKHIGGFAGAISGEKIEIKEWLLRHEQAYRDFQ